MNQLKERARPGYHAGMNLSVYILAAVLAAVSSPAPGAGDLAFARGDFDAAFSAYSAAVASAPNDPAALLGLGTIDLYRNDLNGARAYLTRAEQIDPRNPKVRAELRTLRVREPGAADFQISMRGSEIDVPFIVTDPLPLLRATINGKDAVLLLDTGAPGIGLSTAAAQRLGIATHAVRQRGVFAGGKRAQVRAGRIDTLSLPGLTVRGIPADVLPSTIRLAGYQVDGAVGTTFLRQFLSTIDYRRGALILRPRSASSVAEHAATRSGASVVPMWLVGDHFIFARARVNGAGGLFNIDTGGAGVGVQLTKAALAAARITPGTDAREFMGGGGPVRALTFQARSVSLGNLTRRNVPGLYFPGSDQYGIFPFAVSGTLSHAFFRTTALTFDFAAMKLIVAT